jgi:3-keto-disaccharide hydrolase
MRWIVVVMVATGISLSPERASMQDPETSLFNGRTLDGWRGFTSDVPPPGWSVVDGTLARTGAGGDIVTVDEFGDFDLRLQWKISEGGNSGIIFRVVNVGSEVWESGPEMQILDNARHADGKNPLTAAGANYGLHAPVRDVTRPVGQWNDVRLLVTGAHVEQWLNAVKVVEYELWSPEWESLVKASKFAKMPAYGRAKRGRIALQNHGDPVWFRNMTIRPM